MSKEKVKKCTRSKLYTNKKDISNVLKCKNSS